MSHTHSHTHAQLSSVTLSFQSLDLVLKYCNYFFTSTFVLESILKLIAFGFRRFFKDRYSLCLLRVSAVWLFWVPTVLELIPAATGKQNTHCSGCNKSTLELLLSYYSTAKLAFYAKTQ